jgi:hypothetical protein
MSSDSSPPTSRGDAPEPGTPTPPARAGILRARVKVELHVGALSETVTVTGESPIVDIQNPKQSQVLGRDALTSIPTGRLYNSYAALIPARARQP